MGFAAGLSRALAARAMRDASRRSARRLRAAGASSRGEAGVVPERFEPLDLGEGGFLGLAFGLLRLQGGFLGLALGRACCPFVVEYSRSLYGLRMSTWVTGLGKSAPRMALRKWMNRSRLSSAPSRALKTQSAGGH